MSDSRDKETKLLADAFHGDWNEGAPAHFARVAAARARRQQRTRRVLTASGAAAAVVAIAGLVLQTRSIPEPITPSQSRVAPGYEIISDAELLAELRDRSLVVVQRSNGTNDFVLVGQ